MSLPALHGLLVFDKPAGMTSRAAVDRVQRCLPRRTRIGHTGTLDPLATGILVICVGAATRLGEYVQRMRKTYRTRLQLGARSDTDDAEGTIVPVADATAPDAAKVAACVADFIGTIEQVPPAFSAAKVTGRRAYDLARRGEGVALRPRSIVIYAIEVMRYEYPELDLEVQCGKGTYIRSLARDLGERLGCGSLVQTLRRTCVGPFAVEGALALESLAETVRSQLVRMELAVTELPRLVLAESELKRLCQGKSVALAEMPRQGEAAVFNAANRLIAVAAIDPIGRLLHPRKVLGRVEV